MPLYSLTSNKKISETDKQSLVNIFTDAHCNIMIAPEQFVHIIFSDGIPIRENKSLYIHANVRKGREQNKIINLCDTLKRECSNILNVKEEDILINLLEIEAKWIMEGGHVMPDTGEEDEWIEKVTRALSEREKSILT